MATHPHGKKPGAKPGRAYKPPVVQQPQNSRAFTGPSRLTNEQRIWAHEVIDGLDKVKEVRTGAANGIDTIAAIRSMMVMPEARHRLFVPAGAHNETLEVSGRFEVVHCPDGREPYRIRNQWMLEGIDDTTHQQNNVDELVAFVLHPTFYRSGEWMTINIATDLGIPVQMRRLP